MGAAGTDFFFPMPKFSPISPNHLEGALSAVRAPCVYWDQKEKDEAPPPKTTKTSLGARQKEKERRAAAKDIVLDLSKEEWWYLVANGALFG